MGHPRVFYAPQNFPIYVQSHIGFRTPLNVSMVLRCHLLPEATVGHDLSQITNEVGQLLDTCRAPAAEKLHQVPRLCVEVRLLRHVMQQVVWVENLRSRSGELFNLQVLDLECELIEMYHYPLASRPLKVGASVSCGDASAEYAKFHDLLS